MRENWLRHEGLILAVTGAFGLLLFPALVYLVGQQLLGEYRPDGGIGRFYADLFAALARPGLWAWLLVLGPWLLLQALRLLIAPLRARRANDEPAQDESE
jgi:hypothetical protein